MCVKLRPIEKGVFLGGSIDGHLFYIYQELGTIVSRVRGGFECEYTRQFNNVFEMKSFCSEIVRKDRR